MKRILSALIFGSLLFSSCQEEPLPIIMTYVEPPLLDTTWIAPNVPAKQDKNVLFEDFTGVRCTNCPAGHATLKTMIKDYPGRIVALGIHPGGDQYPQAIPFGGYEDFNTKWGAQIFAIISKPNGIPYGIADRMTGANLVSQWNNLAMARMALPTAANLEARIIEYDSLYNELTFEVKFVLTENQTDALYFSTAITEDYIISKQEFPHGDSLYYEHNHVLRDMPQFKELLLSGNSPEAVPGRVILKQFKYTLMNNWKPENCNLVAFIHKDVEVLQAVEVPIRP